jgi:hypothetical protein
MIEAALRAAGVRTGLFTSPHLVEPTERIQIDGRPVTPEQFCGAFERVQRAAESLDVDGPLTYFETVTAMGFWLFRESGVETAVVEVGLGGRLDTTNVVAPALTVIAHRFRPQVFLGTPSGHPGAKKGASPKCRPCCAQPEAGGSGARGRARHPGQTRGGFRTWRSRT